MADHREVDAVQQEAHGVGVGVGVVELEQLVIGRAPVLIAVSGDIWLQIVLELSGT